MSFINPLDKYPLSSSPMRPPSSARSVAVTTRQSRSPPTWTPRKASTATPMPSRLSQGHRPPPRPLSPVRRRVTRSQSREPEGSRRDVVEDEPSAAHARGKGKAKARQELSSVIEEAPAAPSSSAKRLSQVRTSGGVIPESPDDHDISGTTFLPTDSEPETGDLDAIMMIESLPDLQRAATAILDFFAPSTTPAHIIALAKRLQDPKSSHSRKLERMRSTFATQVKYFGSESYIAVDRIASILPSVELSSGLESAETNSWRVDGILYKSNCAQLALEILTRPSLTESVESSMYDLEGKFPSSFLSALVRENDARNADQSSHRRSTVDLALDIRTQFLKTSLQMHINEETYNPHGLLHRVFFNEILDTQGDVDNPPLRGFNLSGLQDEDGNLPSRYEDDVQDRIGDIRKFFKDNGAVDLVGLEAEFPWEGFVYSLAKWIRLRNEEINRHLNRQPPVDDILDALEDAVNSRTSFNQSEPSFDKGKEVDRTTTAAVEETANHQQPRRELLPPAEITEKRNGSSRRRTFNTVAGVRSLLRINERLSTASADPEPKSDLAARIRQLAARETSTKIAARNADRSRGRAPPPPPERDREIPASPEQIAFPPSADLDQTIVADSQWQDGDGLSQAEARHPVRRVAINLSNASPLEDTVVPSSSQDILATINRFKASKKASSRSAFIDRQTTATRVSPISENSHAARSHQKRKQLEIDDEDSDEEFSPDVRRVDIESKRAQKPHQQPKRPRFFEDDEDEEAGQQLRGDLAFTSSAPAPSSGPARDSGTFSQPAVERSTTAQQTARRPTQRVAPIPSRRRPLPRARKWWTPEEDERLIFLAEEHGCSWATIKREDEVWPEEDGGPQLSDRNQVQLKDRARNIVMNYLKSGRPLPANMDQVTLKTNDIEMLRSMGIDVPERPKLRSN